MASRQLITPADARYIEKAIGKAVRLFDKGQYTACGSEARKILKKFPDCSPALQLMGAVYAELGRHDEAIGFLERTVADDPSDAGAWFNMGKSMHMAGRKQDARAALAKATRLSPASAQFLTEFGTVSLELDFAADAEEAYARALTLDPGSLDAHFNYGQLCAMQARHEEAAEHFKQSVAINPDFFEGHANLGHALQALGQFEEALASCRRALELAPAYIPALATFCDTARHLGAVEASDHMRALVLRCFKEREIDSSGVRGASEQLLLAGLAEQMKAGADSSDSAALDAATGGLLRAHLKHALVARSDLETFLTALRARLLEEQTSGASPEGALTLLDAFARQSFLNEYLWHVTDDEQARVDALETRVADALSGGAPPSGSDLYLLAAYRPLYANDAIRAWADAGANGADETLKIFLDHVIANPAREAIIAAELEQLTGIEDDVSRAVQSQYEANPYPRWDSLTAGQPVAYTQVILDAIAPHRPDFEATSESPKVLVAGCGTGKEPLSLARRIKNADVLAVDLSRASLAYGKRWADELEIANVRFAQGDILKLGALEDRFDVIESAGVLHHMADPEAGLKVLLGLLKPGGFIQLALYSEIAREDIAALRALVAEKGFEPTLAGIRAFREHLRGSGEAFPETSDFYTASTVRDLVFHVQEHRFTLPRIKTMLADNGLEFLGFSMPNPLAKRAYGEKFPDDPDCLDLDNWDRFERDNPRCFEAMYQFWCRKPV